MSKQVFWLQYLPAFVREKIEHRPNVLKVLSNISWLFFDKILRMGVGLIVGVWVARYLGVEQFGMLSFAFAFVALFSVIASLGLNSIVVRDLVRMPEGKHETLGSAFFLQMMGGGVAFVFTVIAIMLLKPNEPMMKLIVIILGSAMIFKCTEVVKYWFEYKVNSKYVVLLENAVFLSLAVVKVVLILLGYSLIAFVWVAFVEVFLVAVGLLAIYVRYGGEGNLKVWRLRSLRVRQLLKNSWPMILSSLAIMIYMRIDQIMIGQILGNEAVGIYTAALRISEIWYFIPMTIVASVFPTILIAKKNNEELYYSQLQKLHDLMLFLAIIVAIPMTFMSDIIVKFLFGTEYIQAGAVLAVHTWTGVFVFLGVASSRWFLAEDLQMIAFYRTILGACLNVILNIFWIPKYGVLGAAWATVVSQGVASMFANILIKKTRKIFYIQCKSFLLTTFINKVATHK